MYNSSLGEQANRAFAHPSTVGDVARRPAEARWGNPPIAFDNEEEMLRMAFLGHLTDCVPAYSGR